MSAKQDDRTRKREAVRRAEAVNDARADEDFARSLEALVQGGGSTADVVELVSRLYRERVVDLGGLQVADRMLGGLLGEPLRAVPALSRPGPALSTDAGRPLDASLRVRLEHLLGTDLAPIRVHDGPDAAAITATRGTRALAHGTDVYVAGPQLRFDTSVLAHEVAHVAIGEVGIACYESSNESETLRLSVLVDEVDGLLARLAESASTAASDDARAESLFSACGDALGRIREVLAVPDVANTGRDLGGRLMAALEDHIRAVLLPAVNDNVVSNAADFQRAAVDLPSTATVGRLADHVRRLRSAEQAASPEASTELLGAATTLQDALLAVYQGLAVEGARDTWTQGIGGDSAGLDDIFAAGANPNDFTAKDRENLPEWCGVFAAAQWRSAGLDEEIRRGLYHVTNVTDLFQYKQRGKSERAPAAIWDEEARQWRSLRKYHDERGSLRTWRSREELLEQMGDPPVPAQLDLRSGDIVLIDSTAALATPDNKPNHVTMVESFDPATGSLRTIEGNTRGGLVPTGSGLEKSKKNYVAVHERDVEKQLAPPEPKSSRIHGAGRPSICDFEEHAYAAKLPPEALRGLSPEQIVAVAAGDFSSLPSSKKGKEQTNLKESAGKVKLITE
jgi:hypothetical protein